MTEDSKRRELVDTLARIAIDEVVDGETAVMRDPPGRRPALDLVARSEWFNSLTENDQSLVVDVMRRTAYGTLHRLLVALDGATPLGPGRLLLTWETDGSVVELAGSGGEIALHDLLAGR